MKQHAIPHNILDIEFKLFGKLTLKQAGFIAIGGISGGLFLLLRASGSIPDLLAWPAFIILSGAGLFLGLVPINDQTADKIISYYFTAISKPTRRVWKNSQFKQRLDVIAEEKGLLLTQGKMDHSNQSDSTPNSKFIGSGPSVPSSQQFKTQNTIDDLDSEEQQKLQYFDKIATQTTSATTQQLVQPQAIQQPQTVQQPQAVQQPQTVQQPQSVQQPQAIQQPQTVQQPVSTQQTITNQQPKTLLSQQISKSASAKAQIAKPTPNQQIKQTPPKQSQKLYTVSAETSPSYPQAQIQVTPSANIPYLQFIDNTNHPIPQALVIIKNSTGTAVQAHQTNPQGAIIPTRPLENGTYIVEIQNNKYNFPNIQYIADGKVMNPIQIKAK